MAQVNSGQNIIPSVRQSLIKWYGEELGANIIHAEAFEICEYGSRPTEEEIKQLFPMLK